MSLNKVLLIGNVGRDPDVRYFDAGAAVANFPLATSERGYTLANGTVIPERTEWHNRSYDDTSGNKRYVTEVHADRVEFYYSGTRPADSTSAQTSASTSPQTASPVQPMASQPAASPSLDTSNAEDDFHSNLDV